MLALDCASTEFFAGGKYKLVGEDKVLDSGGMVKYLAYLVARYPILSIEDGMAEDDWDGWRALTAELGGKVQLVGDDLFVTNPERLDRGLAQDSGNAILGKATQNGTLRETTTVAAWTPRAGAR